MNSNFGYIGRVTLKTICNGKVTSTDYYNSGTADLFRGYAMAMAGQDITNWLPSYIDVGLINTSTKEFTSVLRNHGGVSVVRTFIEDTDGPCTRITATLTNDMLYNNVGEGTMQFRLMSPTDKNILAELNLTESASATLKETLENIPNGTQLIILWDLCVKNQGGT